MTMNRDLFLAILSMDSYNRGYGQGVNNLDVVIGQTRIGNAVISSQVDIGLNSAAITASFYAIAYDMTGVAGFADGERVIAYRGSDYEDTNGNIVRSNDLWQGWTVGAGFAGAQQAELALAFYSAVTGQSPYNTPGTVTLTGHSLGGALAGFVSALSGNRAVLFDHLPFGAGNRLFAPLVRFWKWLEAAIIRVTYQGAADFNHIARLIQHKLEPNGAFGYSRH
jgi:hypothetical protein